MEMYLRMSSKSVYILMWLHLHITCTISNETMAAILDTLFEGREYEKRERPGVNEGIPTHVYVNYHILSIAYIDDVNMQYQVMMYFRSKWLDSRLKHNYSQPVVLEGDASQLPWEPDLFFTNEHRAYIHDLHLPNILTWIYRNGTVYMSKRITATFRCQMQMANYPMDYQTCTIQIESFGHTGRDMTLEWYDRDDVVDPHIDIPEFDIIKAEVGLCDSKFDAGSFPCVLGRLYFKRKYGVFFINTYVPAMLVVVMSWVTFWIDVKVTTPRVSVGLLTVLTTSTQASSSLAHLPRVAYIRAIDIWICACLSIVFAAFLETVIVLVLDHKNTKSHYHHTNCTPDNVPKNEDTVNYQKASGGGRDHIREPTCRDCQLPGRVDRVARILFPSSFISFCVCYFLTFTYVPRVTD